MEFLNQNRNKNKTYFEIPYEDDGISLDMPKGNFFDKLDKITTDYAQKNEPTDTKKQGST